MHKHTHDLFSGVETLTNCRSLSAVANYMVKELRNGRKSSAAEVFRKVWILTLGFGHMLWLQNILFWQNKNSFKEFQWLAHVPSAVALEIWILFLPQPCDLYIFGPIHPWFKMRCRQKWGVKNTDPVLLFLTHYIFSVCWAGVWEDVQDRKMFSVCITYFIPL